MSFPSAPAEASGARRRGLLILGVLLLIAGIGAAIGLYLTSSARYEDAVQNLQRAPVGCDTEFDFTGTGTFVFYAETKGTIGRIRGDCTNADAEYDHGDGRVRVTLSLVDGDGNEVQLDRKGGISYDVSGFTGSAIRSVTIDDAGTYVLSVEGDDTDVVVAVGRNPHKSADSLKRSALVSGLAGLVLGGLLILLGARRRSAGVASPGGGNGLGFPTTSPGSFGPGSFGPGSFVPGPGVSPAGPFDRPGGPPLVSPPQPPLPPVSYPQPTSPPGPPPPAPGTWGAPNA